MKPARSMQAGEAFYTHPFLAQGTVFGAGGEAFVPLCFARSERSLSRAMDRLVSWLERR